MDTPDIVIIGATTTEGKLEPPMRSRFRLQFYLRWYTDEEIEKILCKARKKINKIEENGYSYCLMPMKEPDIK